MVLHGTQVCDRNHRAHDMMVRGRMAHGRMARGRMAHGTMVHGRISLQDLL